MLDLVKQKGFYPYEYMTQFETFKEGLPTIIHEIFNTNSSFHAK